MRSTIWNNITCRFRKTSDYNKNVFRVMSGTSLAQIIGIAFLPVLTRVFSENQFGYFDLLVAISGVFSTVSALKLELTISLPSDEQESDELLAISLITHHIFNLVLVILFWIVGDKLLSVLNSVKLLPISYILIISVYMQGIANISHQLLVRRNKMGLYAKSMVFQAMVSKVIAIVTGYVFALYHGLIYGFIIAMIVTNIYIWISIKPKLIAVSPKRFWELLKKYKRFPLVNTLMVLLNTLSYQLPVYLISYFMGPAFVGFYGLANRVINLPLNFISTAMRKAYFQEAAKQKRENDLSALRKVYLETIKKLSILGAPLLLAMFFFSKLLFPLVFGQNWTVSGEIAQILSIYLIARFITNPIALTLTIINRQEIGLYLTIIYIILKVAVMCMFNYDLILMMIALSLISTVYYLIYNFSIYRLLK